MPLNPETASHDDVVDLIIAAKEKEVSKFIKELALSKLQPEKKLAILSISPIKKPKTLTDIVADSTNVKMHEYLYIILSDALRPNSAKDILVILQKKSFSMSHVDNQKGNQKKFKTIFNTEISLIEKLLDYGITVADILPILTQRPDNLGHQIAVDGDHSCLVNYLNLIKKLLQHKADPKVIFDILNQTGANKTNLGGLLAFIPKNHAAIKTFIEFLTELSVLLDVNVVVDLVAHQEKYGAFVNNFVFNAAKFQNDEAHLLCLQFLGKLIKAGGNLEKIKSILAIHDSFDSYGNAIYHKKKDSEAIYLFLLHDLWPNNMYFKLREHKKELLAYLLTLPLEEKVKSLELVVDQHSRFGKVFFAQRLDTPCSLKHGTLKAASEELSKAYMEYERGERAKRIASEAKDDQTPPADKTSAAALPRAGQFAVKGVKRPDDLVTLVVLGSLEEKEGPRARPI